MKPAISRTDEARAKAKERAAEAIANPHNCACGLFGSYRTNGIWFCRDHVPPDFWDNVNPRPAWLPPREAAASVLAPQPQGALGLPLMTGKGR